MFRAQQSNITFLIKNINVIISYWNVQNFEKCLKELIFYVLFISFRVDYVRWMWLKYYC